MLKTIISTTAFLILFISTATAQNNPGKKNTRPTETNAETVKTAVKNGGETVYSYEFSQPQYVVSHIRIMHDENGKGTITLGKKDFEEEYTDPLQLSEATMEKLDALWNGLNFLESIENYQSEKRDYGHLGNMTFTMKQNGSARTAKFNWSENADAQGLAQEYKRITNQFVWIFDIEVSRQNQPLESPRLMDTLDSLIKRNEISDPNQIIPYLQKLSEDERFPLITRNHALRLIKEIEKKSEAERKN